MSRTLTLPKKGSGLWTEGWHTMKINKAEYGDWNGTKYLDLWFVVQFYTTGRRV